MRTLLWTAGCLAAIVCAVSASPQLVSHSQRRLSQQSETTSTDSSTQGGPLTSFVTSINGFFEVSSSVNVNNVPSEDTVSETGDYSAFAFPASSFNTSVIVNVSTGVPDVISQSVALVIADAIARNATGTASDLIFQALIRQTAAQTTALTLNAMIQEVGCMEPLVEALVGASTIAEETSDMVIWPLALRGISADVSYLAQCLAIIGY